MIAISRCEDYRHDVYDVTCGSLLGLFVAYWSYRRFYPKLRNRTCHKPYEPKGSDTAGFTKIRDDVEAVLREGTGPSAFNLGESDSGDES
jgi:diacylglycerol diphosphate phosphatase/phosphatidate phosphatase